MKISGFRILSSGLLIVLLTSMFVDSFAQSVALQNVTIYQEKISLGNGETAASEMLSQEVAKRTGIAWPVSATWPSSGDVIVLKKASAKNKVPFTIPSAPVLGSKAESYRIVNVQHQNQKVIIIEGVDDRGVLFGTANLLRILQYAKNSASLEQLPSLTTSPDKYLRGHQLGYRNTANSWDAWTKPQFEQYIRDLVVFGTNAIESIPIFDEKVSPHFKEKPSEMNIFISQLCQKYNLEYWMWIPAQFDLKDVALRNKYLATFEQICKESVRIDGAFFPGGDPGDNPPDLVMPLLQDIAVILKKYHPKAATWVSLQGFTPEQSQYVYKYIQDKMPVWLGGLITGPSSPTVEETRAALPAKYKLRHYPDVTHNVRCEFEIPWWDPSFALTLGREAINPRPYHYSAIYHAIDPYIDGFISYSDGVHDDVNKVLWSQLAWDRNVSERNIMKEYSNYFFGSNVAEDAGDGILALEKNWEGPIVSNGGIATTLTAWKKLEKENPSLETNWRWQMNLLRAYYDAYTRERFVYETQLEKQMNEKLLQASSIGADAAMKEANTILAKADTEPVMKDVHQHIIDLCEALFKSISLQTSVKKYQASGLERGSVLDFLDRRLNNRWWLEDEFKKIQSLPEADRVKALEVIANWETPGPGSYYDEVGNLAKSVHEMKGENWRLDPILRESPNPGYDFTDNGMSRKRLSWLTYMRWPIAMKYTTIDPNAHYTVKINGMGECLLKINGQRVAPSHYGRNYGEIKEFPVPQEMVKSGKLVLTWDTIDEDFMNWRKQSRVTEVWLIKE
ncbi:hypothetical protein WBG78_20820 [Chryseolinea sp. T2]|uniref:hypothetical protein n=1 Tax=Chryseolinea sp. T2 TaxID=3129255 RepID=UPI0030769898